MSQLEQTFPSVGAPDQLQIQWKSFVQAVLEVTVQAYQNMRRRSNIGRGWEEDVFTLNLFKHILPLASRHPMCLNAKSQVPVFTPDMEIGAISPKEANEIDIQLWIGSWENHDRIYFAWEAKLIVDRLLDEKHKYLVAKYITDGLIDRFIDGKYANEVDDAGMLGYILAGDAATIVKDINRSMQDRQRIRKLLKSDHLKIASSIGDFTDVYLSCHSRISCARKIRLYHLFLTFDFD